MKALPSATTFRFVPSEDRALPHGQQTTFHLRRLTVGERAAIADMELEEVLSQDENGRALLTRRRRPGMSQLERVRAGLAGWDNLQDANGAPILFVLGPPRQVAGRVAGCVSDELLDLIPENALIEIERAIYDAARLTDEDRKNSQSPQPSPSTGS